MTTSSISNFITFLVLILLPGSISGHAIKHMAYAINYAIVVFPIVWKTQCYLWMFWALSEFIVYCSGIVYHLSGNYILKTNLHKQESIQNYIQLIVNSVFLYITGVSDEDKHLIFASMNLLLFNAMKNTYENQYISNGDRINLFWDGKGKIPITCVMLTLCTITLFITIYNHTLFTTWFVMIIFVILSYPYSVKTSKSDQITAFRETSFENNQFDKYTKYPRDGVYKKLTVFHVNGFVPELKYNFYDLYLHVESKVFHYQTRNPLYFYQSEKFSVNRYMNDDNVRMKFRKHKYIPMVYECLLYDGDEMFEKNIIIQEDLFYHMFHGDFQTLSGLIELLKKKRKRFKFF